MVKTNKLMIKYYKKINWTFYIAKFENIWLCYECGKAVFCTIMASDTEKYEIEESEVPVHIKKLILDFIQDPLFEIEWKRLTCNL